MELSFQHANPRAGNESTIIRVDGLLPDQPVCLLVDAGAGVDVTDALAPDEYLTGVLLTHAHLDHYRRLGENLVDGAPVYASEPTATILDRVLDMGAHEDDLSEVDAVRDALEPVDGWTTIVDGLDIYPVPAGHTPGAAGFLLRVRDGDETTTVLVTGDFTRRPTAGYEPLPATLPVDVDVLVVNAVTREEYTETLNDALDTLLGAAEADSRVVAATSGLRGVQIAYQLGHLADHLDQSVPIRVVGRAAKLAESLEYDVPNVEWVPTFADPEDVLEAGGVTVSAPPVPVDGSTSVLYREVAADPDATVVQLADSETEAVAGDGCETARYVFGNYPTRETVDDLVSDLAPIHVVVNHQTGRDADRYKDEYRSYVWAPSDERAYTLRDDSGWTAPPWVTEQTRQLVWDHRREQGPRVVESDGDLQTPGRADSPDLDAEGIDLDHFRRRVDGSDETASADEGASPPAPAATGDTETTTDGDDASERHESRTTPGDARGAATRRDGDSDGKGDSRDDGPSTRVVLARLARLEAALDGEVHDATVVDAGDDVTMLRLDESPAGLDHGDEVGVRIVPEFDR